MVAWGPTGDRAAALGRPTKADANLAWHRDAELDPWIHEDIHSKRKNNATLMVARTLRNVQAMYNTEKK